MKWRPVTWGCALSIFSEPNVWPLLCYAGCMSDVAGHTMLGDARQAC